VNAAFLLVTSAWRAGQAPPPVAAPAAAPAPAPAAASYGGCNGGCSSGCGGDCNACCDSGGLFGGGGGGRLRGLFSKHKGGNCCDSCAQTCAQPTCAQPTCAASSCCDDGCGRQGLFSRLGGLCKKNKGCGNDCGTCGTSCCDDGCGRSSGGRLRGLFSKHKGGDCCDSCNTCGSGCGTGCANGGCANGGYAAPAGAAPAGAEPIAPPKTEGEPKKMPESGNQAMKQVQIITPASEINNPFELHRRHESRVAHAPDYSWLTGQLFYVHADGGLWILRYAPLWQEDQNGGSIVLARDLRMGNYHEGDLVTVHGEILSKKGSVFLGGPLYRAQSIELVDRDAK